MLRKVDPTQTMSWRKLKDHFAKVKDLHMRDLFAEDAKRFDLFSIRFNDLLVDYSKNRITAETMRLLLTLAEETFVRDAIDQMFAGHKINETENRPVLHVALRNRGNRPIHVDGQDVMPQVNSVLKKIEDFSHEVISGRWKGFTGKRVSDIVNIGIGAPTWARHGYRVSSTLCQGRTVGPFRLQCGWNSSCRNPKAA